MDKYDYYATVEDMDLSLRAYLRGWKFIFLDDVTCMNEIPADYDAFRKQQHRWSCGPMQLWRKAMAGRFFFQLFLSTLLCIRVSVQYTLVYSLGLYRRGAQLRHTRAFIVRPKPIL